MDEEEVYDEELIKIKTLCEFLFFDQYQDSATFLRFEKCFQPLFNNIDISMEKVFKDICGPKKKYITFKRFAKAYDNYITKKDCLSKDTHIFFDKLFNSILKTGKSFVGENIENVYSFSTVKACRKRDCITMIQVLSDKEGNIHGINLEYDNAITSKMYPKICQYELMITLEMNLDILDKNSLEKNTKIFSDVSPDDFRDAITHIFGTINKEKGFINFLGFKCVSGKTVYVGFPEGDGFLFGKFGTRFHDIKLQMKKEGITKLEPGFKKNSKTNFFLEKIKGYLSEQDIDEDEMIKDEEILANIDDKDEIDKFITVPIFEDNHFFNQNLKDETSGNDYKEVINQTPRKWLLADSYTKIRKRSDDDEDYENNDGKGLTTVGNALKRFNKEKEKTVIRKTMLKMNEKKNINQNQDSKENIFDSSQNPFKLNPILEEKKESPPQQQQSMPFLANPFFTGAIANEPEKPKEKEETKNKDYENEDENEKEEGLLLHKTKIFQPSTQKKGENESNGQIWDGKIDEKTSPNFFLSKNNYQRLKDSLGNLIRDEIIKNIGDDENDTMQREMLNTIIPVNEENKNRNKKKRLEIIEEMPVLKIQNLNGQMIDLDNIEEKDEDSFDDEEFNEDNEHKEDSGKTIVYSDGAQFWKNVTSIKNNSENDDETKAFNKNMKSDKLRRFHFRNIFNFWKSDSKSKEKNEKEKIKAAQEKWKYFRKYLEKINGVYLLQIIASITRAKYILLNRIPVPIAKKYKLYQIMEENEKIIQLVRKNEDSKPKEEEEDNLESLIPDKHPEKVTSLAEIQKDLENLKELLEKQNLKPEDKNKIEKLYNLYLQQKNILIENESKKEKDNLIKQNGIDTQKYLQEEEEKRKKAKEEEQKEIEKELEIKERKTTMLKGTIVSTSILSRKVETNVYGKQKIPSQSETWKDQILPAEKKSLCPYNKYGWDLPEEVLDDDVIGWENANWCRPDEIKDFEGYNIFEKGATVDDINQGNIGDCYFFSAVGSLCNYPDFFNKLFHIKQKSSEHIYGVYLYLNGKWKLVLIDDYFPCISNDNTKEFFFSCSFQNELWVSLLEKAWAKVNGCYANIGCGGFCYEAFDVLTEAYTEHLDFEYYKKEDIWKKMENAHKKNYVMTAGTGDKSVNLLESLGLCAGHAYTIINIVKMEENGVRLVKLKNPWGNTEFTGEWSDGSRKWTPELKKKYKYEGDEDEGIFFMSFNDFFKYFAMMDIAKLEQGYKNAFCKIKKTEAIKLQVIELVGTKDNQNAYIQLYQKNPRIVRKNGQKYPQPAMAFIILVDSEFNYIKSTYSNNCHLGIEVDLKAGKYYIFCDVNYRNETPDFRSYGYTVTCYSKHGIKSLKNVTKKIDEISQLEFSMYNYCIKNSKSYQKNKGLKIYKSENFNNVIPFTVLCFVNTTKKPLKVKLNVKYEGKKSFCIYNDDTASEFDSSVIKELAPEGKPGYSKTILIMDYSNKEKYLMIYDPLPENDSRTYENDHSIFKKKPIQEDKERNLYIYCLKVNNGKGYILGLENKSDKEYNLKLKLEGAICIDAEFKGKSNPGFKILPKTKKVFNIRIKDDAKEYIFKFE